MTPIIAQPRAGQQSGAAEKPEIRGRVVTGYQGWFRAPGDGTDQGWVHWGGRRQFPQRRSTVDMWPDMSEYTSAEKFPTPYRHADGSVAHVFSSAHPRTVRRHFEWMRDYGIGGAMQQRFVTGTRSAARRASLDRVLANTRAASRATGTPWALMYDLSGLKAGEIRTLLFKDIRRLIVEEKILQDPYYLHHDGKPLIAVWGVGFRVNRNYSVEESIELVELLQNDRDLGGNAVMLGVPYWWRENVRDAEGHERFHELLRRVEIVSPWSVGRVRDPRTAASRVDQVLRPDLAWTRRAGNAYLPVISPGFSWVNLQRSRGVADLPAYEAIPRLDGAFLWSQAVAAKQAGAEMIYVAMFDEVDEATCIFKVTNDPPVNGTDGERFISYGDNVPSDHYLWLTGEISRMLRGETPTRERMPRRRAVR
ncbi:MAG: glycoside hydrolase family 71/99-like protein [Planctomycetota bacterium]